MSDEVESALKEISMLVEAAKSLEQAIYNATPDQQKRLTKIKSEREALDEEENQLKGLIRENAMNLTSRLDDVTDEIQHLKSKVKRLVHQMPAAECLSSKRYREDHVSITVSKVQVRKSYNPNILNKYPWMKDYRSMSGGTLTEVIVKPHVVQEMIDNFDIEESRVKEFEILTKERAPSVRFTFNGEKR